MLITKNVEYYGVERLSKAQKELKVIKEHKEECKVDSSVIVKDLSLLVHGPQEDEVFIYDPQLWANIRRGNTLLELYDPMDYTKLIKVVYGRKGLNKFFDLQYDFISREGRYMDDHLDDYNYNMKNYIFAPVKKALLDGHQVEVVKTLKCNGENMQVSWNPEI